MVFFLLAWSPSPQALAETKPPIEKSENNMSDERKNYALKTIAKHPQSFREIYRNAILDGRVELGMTPFEAKLAGGAFFFEVMADSSKWPDGTDPYKVMWTQTESPDKSEIWMIFKNSTQFSTEFDCAFRVYFKQGKAVNIERMAK